MYVIIIIMSPSSPPGVIVNLKYPYPRKVKEHIQYEEAVFSEPIDDITDPEILASLNITQKPPSTHADQSVPSRFTVSTCTCRYYFKSLLQNVVHVHIYVHVCTQPKIILP